jgi:hypothetical protein
MSGRPPVPFVALLLAAMTLGVLTGCATGERPTLVAEDTAIADPVAKAVADLLVRAPDTVFTATYTITPTLTNEPTQATVVQNGLRRRIAIGSVEYTSDGTVVRTCVVGGGECADGIDEARISNLNITHAFWGESAAARMRVDASRSVQQAVGRTETIGGQPATCADLTIPAPEGVGTVVYCALDAGILARYVGVDVRIELTAFSPVADEAQLTF